MNNETKRDVLVNAVDALADAQASSDNNVGLGHQDADLFMAEYDEALPDDLPVIPEAIGEYIDVEKNNNDVIQAGIDAIEYSKGSIELTTWIEKNGDTFARAWLLGVWRVEEIGEIVKLEAEK